MSLSAITADITPSLALPLFGRTGRPEPVDSVASRLEANCLLIGDDAAAAIVTIDSLYPSQALVDSIRGRCAEHGLEFCPEGLMVVASHTHNAPALDRTKPKLGPCAADYLDFVAGRIATSLLTLAHGKGAPISQLLHGQAPCSASCFRRRWVSGVDFTRLQASRRMLMVPNFAVSIEQALHLLIFSDADGTPRAVLWSWPCHAVSEPKAMQVSADFPGALRTHIRAALDDAALPVLYFPGFSGDIRPASRSLVPIHKSGKWVGFGPRFARPSPRRAEVLRANLTEAFDEARASIRHCGGLADMALARTRRSLAVDKIRSEAQGLAPLTCDDWCLGPVRIKAVSAEVASGYSAAVGGTNSLTFLTGCAGQVFGYVPMESQILEGGYEVEGFAEGFSVPGAFHDEIEAKLSWLIGE